MKLLKNSIVLLLILVSCKPDFTPKPRGYYRIDFPEKEYLLFDSTCPFKFEFPVYGDLIPTKNNQGNNCWYNLEFPEYNATIYLTYKPVNAFEDLVTYTEDIHKIAYKHTIKANAINETVIHNPELHKLGVLYDISGNAASQLNFYLTDSANHFISGALYFNSSPNYDSLAPVLRFFRKDIVHLIESLEWK